LPKYYLDTSAHMERVGGKTEIRDRLKAMLGREMHATSSQVLREWNRIVFVACTKLLKVLPTAKDRMDVVNAMKQGYGREAARNWQVTEWIMGPDEDFRLIEKRADDYARVRARAYFRAATPTVRDGTDCAVAARVPYEVGRELRYKHTCEKDHEICRQPEFLSENLAKAKAAATALLGARRKGDRKMGEKALRALDALSNNGSKGKACWAGNGIGGDICIALECAPDETLLAVDESFDYLCPALELEHEKIRH
jgi:hypothetical protein